MELSNVDHVFCRLSRFDPYRIKWQTLESKWICQRQYILYIKTPHSHKKPKGPLTGLSHFLTKVIRIPSLKGQTHSSILTAQSKRHIVKQIS